MASEELTKFHDYVDGILLQLSSSARKQLAKEIALKLRAVNRKRITAQIQPDGSKFQPRKKQGRIKRKMFTKLRTTRYLKMKSTPNSATVEFIGNAGTIARVHHYGLRDRVESNIKAKYPKRELLGITATELIIVEELVLNHLLK